METTREPLVMEAKQREAESASANATPIHLAGAGNANDGGGDDDDISVLPCGSPSERFPTSRHHAGIDASGTVAGAEGDAITAMVTAQSAGVLDKEVTPQRAPPGDVGRAWRRVGMALVLGVLYFTTVACRSALSFPYLRTLISCDFPTPSDFDRDDDDWSGSKNCNDSDYVVDRATLLRGIAQGTDSTLQCLAVPVWGRVSDSFGRRPVALVTISGLTAASALFYISALEATFSYYFLGFLIQGVTGAMGALMSATTTDVSEYDTTRGSLFGTYLSLNLVGLIVAILAITIAFIADNPYDYDGVALVLLIIVLVLQVLFMVFFPESHPRSARQPWRREYLNPCRSFSIIREFPFVGQLCWPLVGYGFSFASLSVLQGYVVKLYDWSNAESTYLFLYALVVVALATASASVVIPKFGMHNSVRAGMLLSTAGYVLLIFAPLGPAMAYIGLMTLGVGAFTIPVALTVFAREVPTERGGQLQGALASLLLLSGGIGTGVHAGVFSLANDTKAGSTLPFIIAAAVTGLSGLRLHFLLVGHVPPRHGALRSAAAAESGEPGESGESGESGDHGRSEVRASLNGEATPSAGEGDSLSKGGPVREISMTNMNVV